MSTTRSNRYQEGSIDRVKRAKGKPDVWVFRWRELQPDGTRVQRKKTIGTIEEFPRKSEVQRQVENLRSEINARQDRVGKTTLADAWGHFQIHELHNEKIGRSETTVSRYLELFERNILPVWGTVPLDEVKTVQVESWLNSIPKADATRAKLRNVLCLLFNHAIRWELHDRNPISGPSKGSGVRQSSLRSREPDILSLDEVRALLPHIRNEAIKVMVIVAAGTGMRRSEICGLRWRDLDFEKLWFDLKRGVVHNIRLPKKDWIAGQRRSRPTITKLKTAASRKGVPMTKELAALLGRWRDQTPYPSDDDWVFASPNEQGAWPYNPSAAMRYWVQPAAKSLGIKKRIGWHTFRHSVASLLGQSGESVKVVQELLRHANSRITQDIYMQADQSAKREALNRLSGLHLVPDKKSA